MRSLFSLFCILILLAAGGCAGRPVSETKQFQDVPRPGDVSDQLFFEAEQSAAEGRADQAMLQFGNYLARYPEGRFADAALLNMGRLYRQKNAVQEAHAFFQRLIENDPQSPAAVQARLEIIDLLIAESRFQEALDNAAALGPDRPGEDPAQQELWKRLSQIHRALGQPGKAAVYEYRLYKAVPEEEKAKWAGLFNQALPQLTPDHIQALWDHVEDPTVRGDLMYQFILSEIAAGNDASAYQLLELFVQTFSGHPKSAEAAILLENLSRQLSFKPYTIGCLLPLSGPYQKYGQQALQGVELALSLAQTADNAPSFRLVVKDAGSDDRQSVEGVRQLDEEGAGIIIGPIATAPAAAVEAQKRRIPMITFTQKADITTAGDFIFRHFITPQSQVRSLVDFFVNRMGLRTFAILYPLENYGQTFMKAFEEEVRRQGGSLVGAEPYDSSQNDFSETIGKFVARHRLMTEQPGAASNGGVPPKHLSDPEVTPSGDGAGSAGRPDMQRVELDFEVLFIPDEPKVAALILPQLAYHDAGHVYLAGTNLWHSPQLVRQTRDYAQNAVMVDGFFKESESETVQRFVQSYREIYNSDPGLIEALAYDTAAYVLNVMAHSDIRMRQDLRDALWQNVPFEGVTGPLSFERNGEAVKQLRLLRVQGNRFVEIQNP